MKKTKRIMIIGGCGYLGSALYKRLNSAVSADGSLQYPKYIVDTCDLEWFGNVINKQNLKIDMNELEASFLKLYDVVILLAGHSSVAMAANSSGISAFANNVHNFMTLLPKLADETKFIYAGSASVYNGLTDDLVDETANLKNPKQLYDLTKQEIDHYMLLNLFPNIEYYGLRMATVCGISPNMRVDTMTNMMVYTAEETGKINVLNGNNRRPLLTIQDFIGAIETIIDETKDLRGIYNLSSFNGSIQKVAELVAKCTGAEVKQTSDQEFSNILGGKVPPPLDFSISSYKYYFAFNQVVAPAEGLHQTENTPIENTILHTMTNLDSVLLKSTRAQGKNYGL